MKYRGFTITKVAAVQVGYAPAVHNKAKHTMRQRTRKITGYIVTDASGYERFRDTLAEAKHTVDLLDGVFDS